MKQRDSGQDFDPKHRIVGAIVVVALAVILIPLFLGEREMPAQATASQTIEPTEPGAEANKVVVVPVTRAGRITESEKPTPPAPEPKAVTPAAAQEPPTPPAEPAVATAKAATAPGSGWVVQVGTFANAANATRLEQKLRAGGQPVLAERISFEGGKAVRLRVGPFRDRATALKTQERIQKDTGVKGVVLAYP